jgi:hypothetical protein
MEELKPTEGKINRTQQELTEKLSEQLSLLSSYIESYDSGKKHFAMPMATVVRVLLHDTKKSKSLLSNLGRKENLRLYNTADDLTPDKLISYDEANPNKAHIKFYPGDSTMIGLGRGALGNNVPDYYPVLDNPIGKKPDYIDFDTWWNNAIFFGKDTTRLSRRDIVLTMADQDGGAHVDPGLKANYANLKHDNPQKVYIVNIKGGKGRPSTGAELALMRQIAHEVMKTLCTDYKTPHIEHKGISIGFTEFDVVIDPPQDIK